MRHHAEGIYGAERVFGVTIDNRDGVQLPVHCIGEQHVTAELGRVPSVKEWLELIRPKVWMARASKVIRTARSRTSGEYLVRLSIAPSFHATACAQPTCSRRDSATPGSWSALK